MFVFNYFSIKTQWQWNEPKCAAFTPELSSEYSCRECDMWQSPVWLSQCIHVTSPAVTCTETWVTWNVKIVFSKYKIYSCYKTDYFLSWCPQCDTYHNVKQQNISKLEMAQWTVMNVHNEIIKIHFNKVINLRII